LSLAQTGVLLLLFASAPPSFLQQFVRPMKLIGIPLRMPSYGETTAAAIMGVGLWLGLLGLSVALHWPVDRVDAGALLIVSCWGCLCARVGIDMGRGGRHVAANMLVAALLLGIYNGAWALSGL
jgi:hypothetical protein